MQGKKSEIQRCALAVLTAAHAGGFAGFASPTAEKPTSSISGTSIPAWDIQAAQAAMRRCFDTEPPMGFPSGR